MIKIIHGTPKTPGLYLWIGEYTNTVKLINVVKIEQRFEYGIGWDEYLAVVEYAGKNVTQLCGTFSKALEITKNGILKEID